MISGNDCLNGIQGWSADDRIIGRGLVDQEEVDHLCDLRRALAKVHWELDGPFRVDLFSAESIQWRLDRPRCGASYIHLAECGSEKDVYGASNINQDTEDFPVGNIQGHHQGVCVGID